MASTRFRRGVALFVVPLALLIVALCIMNGKSEDGEDAGKTSSVVPYDDSVSVQEGQLSPDETYELPYDVDRASRTVLEQYRDAGEGVVVRSGYLDLRGRTWSCLLQGPGWVDLCVVTEKDDRGSQSTVQRVRMDAEDWRKGHGE